MTRSQVLFFVSISLYSLTGRYQSKAVPFVDAKTCRNHADTATATTRLRNPRHATVLAHHLPPAVKHRKRVCSLSTLSDAP